MDPAAWYVLSILVVSLVLFVWDRFPIDVVGLGIILALVLGRILTPAQATKGFANAALLTVGFLFVVSEGLIRTGAVGWIGQQLVRIAGGSQRRLLLVSMGAAALLSAFINNTPVVVLFVPIALGLSERFGVSPSKLLLPICYAATLGGTCTLIGTSTNLAINAWITEFGPEHGLRPFGMFDFTGFGVLYALVGLLYLYLLGPRLLPDRKSLTATLAPGRHKEYVTELLVPEGSPLVGSPVARLAGREGVRLLQLIRGEEIHWPPLPDWVLAGGDLLILKGDVARIIELQRTSGFEVPPELAGEAVRSRTRDLTFAEVAVTPHSPVVGRTLEEIDFHSETGAHVLALQRHGSHIRSKVSGIPLQMGDVLLVQCEAETVRNLRSDDSYLVLEGVAERVLDRKKAPIAVAVFLVIVTLASFELHPALDILFLSLGGAFLLVATRTLTSARAYRSVQWSVLVLIASMIALAEGMRVTGLEHILAGGAARVLAPYGPHIVLVAFLLVTAILAEVLSNTATGLLLIPIAAGIALELGVDPTPFAIAVVFGSSIGFATPFCYQTNAFVYGPGGYRFLDYVRIGLPLDLLLVSVAAVMIPVFWPF